ncbi:expressed unknown protein [Seminavis robusta]|uniref:Uncharacterized protein n=1 Tax=Seminavis robusta TaxID=568900 RepID=A0A9N8DB93_9STRA|nr:expressed unknown protein [Seminavis robusta]|eukprot:Sro70_g038770.1 n/a (282) ;mRNA; f:14098-15032
MMGDDGQAGSGALAGPEDYFTQRQKPDDKTFPQFSELGDLKLEVLQFVAEAPFEGQSLNYVSTLTHSLPLVSKELKSLSETDSLWKDSLFRQVTRDPEVWGEGVKKMFLSAGGEDQEGEAWPNLLERVLQTLQLESYRDLYRQVLNSQVRTILPMFVMFQPMRNQPYGLHFFEPRYRLLIADVMAPYPLSSRQGGPIVVAEGQNPPVFIHGNTHPLMRGSPAWLVQVVRCRIYEDGRADVFSLPLRPLIIESIWELPNSGHLYAAQCIKASPREAEAMPSS